MAGASRDSFSSLTLSEKFWVTGRVRCLFFKFWHVDGRLETRILVSEGQHYSWNVAGVCEACDSLCLVEWISLILRDNVDCRETRMGHRWNFKVNWTLKKVFRENYQLVWRDIWFSFYLLLDIFDELFHTLNFDDVNAFFCQLNSQTFFLFAFSKYPCLKVCF